MRKWYAKFSPEERRQKRQGRDPVVAREQDRRKMLRRRHHGTPEQKLKIAARRALNNAVNAGKLIRGSCEMADRSACEGPIHGHHDDYSKPLEVRWLCRFHHDQLHEGGRP